MALAAYAPAPRSTPAAGEDAPDPPLFAAAIQHFRAGALGELRVDPRPLRAGADLESLDPGDLAPPDEATTRARADVLQRLSVRAFDVFADRRCVSAIANHAPASEVRATVAAEGRREDRDGCAAQGPFTVLVVSAPVAIDETNGVVTWKITVARLTNGAYDVRELWLRRAPGARVTLRSAAHRSLRGSA